MRTPTLSKAPLKSFLSIEELDSLLGEIAKRTSLESGSSEAAVALNLTTSGPWLKSWRISGVVSQWQVTRVTMTWRSIVVWRKKALKDTKIRAVLTTGWNTSPPQEDLFQRRCAALLQSLLSCIQESSVDRNQDFVCEHLLPRVTFSASLEEVVTCRVSSAVSASLRASTEPALPV